MDDAYIPSIVPDEDIEFFEKGNFGSRIGWGDSPALVVVDMTREFTTDEYALGRADTASEAISSISELLEVSRRGGVPVFYTKPESQYPEKYPGTTKSTPNRERRREGANHIHPDIQPVEDDVVIEKPRASAFYDTHFDSMLHHYGIDTLIVTGMTTSGCVRATVVDACSGNYRTIVPIPSVADRGRGSHEFSLFDMDMKYADVMELEPVLSHLQSIE